MRVGHQHKLEVDRNVLVDGSGPNEGLKEGFQKKVAKRQLTKRCFWGSLSILQMGQILGETAEKRYLLASSLAHEDLPMENFGFLGVIVHPDLWNLTLVVLIQFTWRKLAGISYGMVVSINRAVI